MDAKTFADAVGRKTLAEALGVGVTAVNNAVQRGAFPATWFFVAQGVAASQGVACDNRLFNFKAPNGTPEDFLPAANLSTGGKDCKGAAE